MQTTPPTGDRHQQQPMPEAEAPRRLGRVISRHGHDGSVHEGGQGRNLGGQIKQGLPAAPAIAGQQAKGLAVVHGAVEVVGLIPGRNTGLGLPPQPVHGRGQQPDQGHPERQAPALPHAISKRRRSSCNRLRRCLASRSISRPSCRYWSTYPIV